MGKENNAFSTVYCKANQWQEIDLCISISRNSQFFDNVFRKGTGIKKVLLIYIKYLME